MRILLDESVPRHLKRLLPDHETLTAVECGWGSIENGELLARGAEQFDVFITADQKIPIQQRLASFDVAVVVLVAPTNTMVHYEPMAERIRDAVGSAAKGESLWVTA
jgi:hypothetical protein